MLIGELKGRTVYEGLKYQIMEGAVRGLLVGPFHLFLCTRGIFVFHLLRIWCKTWRAIIRTSDSPHMWNFEGFADFIGLVQFHSKLYNYYCGPEGCKS